MEGAVDLDDRAALLGELEDAPATGEDEEAGSTAMPAPPLLETAGAAHPTRFASCRLRLPPGGGPREGSGEGSGGGGG